MSAVKIKSAGQLEKFLRVLAEESVSYAREDMAKPSAKSRQDAFAKRISKDIAALSEEDEEVAEPPTPKSAPPQAEKPAAPPPEKPEPEAKEPVADLNPTVADLVDAIKDIRGGMGAGDSAIEEELQTYFGRLVDAERVSLVVMLRSIGSIMRQRSTGTDAQEPEDMNIFTTMKPSESSPEQPAAATAPVHQTASKPTAGGEEDTSPPIKVGQQAVTEAYRSRIRDLLKRS